MRRLLALSLGQTLSKQYGEQDRAEEIDTLEADCRKALEDQSPSDLKRIWNRANKLLDEGEWDPVDRLRLLALYAEARRAED